MRRTPPEGASVRVRLSQSLFLLPNMVTLASVFCGFSAVLLCASAPDEKNFHRAALLIGCAMFFDILDGRVARMTRTQSAFGVELDSLADAISFGLAPALLVYRWSLHEAGIAGVAACSIYLACGILRLARFNVLATDRTGAPKKPSRFIVGLPIPAAAGIVISLVIGHGALEDPIFSSPSAVLATVVGLSFLMVSTVRFRSFKDIKLSRSSVTLAGLAVVTSTFIAVRFHVALAMAWLLASYVTMALVETLLGVPHRSLAADRSN